jgi:hypothetical protein
LGPSGRDEKILADPAANEQIERSAQSENVTVVPSDRSPTNDARAAIGQLVCQGGEEANAVHVDGTIDCETRRPTLDPQGPQSVTTVVAYVAIHTAIQDRKCRDVDKDPTARAQLAMPQLEAVNIILDML